MSADEIAQPKSPSSTKPYKAAIGILTVALVASIALYFTSPQTVYIEPQKDQLVEFDGDNYSKDELIAKVKAGQSRVAEAYAFGAYYCSDLVGTDGGGFKFADSTSRIQGMNIVIDMDCHTQDGGVNKYRITYNQDSGMVLTTSRGPSL